VRTATIERVPDPSGLVVDEVWNKEWQKNLFDAAIERVKGQVSARQYQMFDLYVIKQWPVRKVASRLGVNIGRLYLAKHRISSLIKKEVKRLEKRLI
jgi:RNA polymerase sigma-70 factor (ECF subfamily)